MVAETQLVSTPAARTSIGQPRDCFFQRNAQDARLLSSRLERRALISSSASEKRRLLKLAEVASRLAACLRPSGGAHV